MRTSGGAVRTSPITRATSSSGAGSHSAGACILPSKPRIRNSPQRVGNSASAICVTLASAITPFYVGPVAWPPPPWDAGRLGPIARRIQRIGCRAAKRDRVDGVTNTLVVITVLIKLGVAAAVASALARSRTFQRLLFADRRKRGGTVALLAFFLVPLTLGVWVRTRVPNFLAADLSFETVILLGLLLGPAWALLAGLVLAIPAAMHHEFLAPAFYVAVGLVSG